MHVYTYEISRSKVEELRLILLPKINDILTSWLEPSIKYYSVKLNDPKMWYFTSSTWNEDYTPEERILDSILCSLGDCIYS